MFEDVVGNVLFWNPKFGWPVLVDSFTWNHSGLRESVTLEFQVWAACVG